MIGNAYYKGYTIQTFSKENECAVYSPNGEFFGKATTLRHAIDMVDTNFNIVLECMT